MTASHPEDSDRLNDPAFQDLLVSCLEKLEKGEDLDREALLNDHPEYAKDLALFLDDRELLAELAESLHDTPSSQFLRGNSLLAETILSEGDQRSMAPGDRVRYIGEYEILSEVARGGMGVVYKARQRKLKRIVALKMIRSGRLASSEDVSRFKREAQAAAQLKHPGIVPIHEIGQHEGQAYFTMDFVEGQSLANLIRDEALPPKRAANWLRQIAEAIQFAHKNGIVHRDLKPANILIDDSDRPQVTDFGLAKILETEQDDSNPELTLSGQILGTPSYMSPEQATGKKNLVGPATDVYSLGAILYASLTGRAPFVAESSLDTIRLVTHTDPIAPRTLNPRLPRDLETICLKCLEKEPHKRYGTAQLLADDLQRFEDGRPVLARPIGLLQRGYRWGRRHPAMSALLTAGLIMLLLVVGLGVGWSYQQELETANSELDSRNAELQNANTSLASSRQSLENANTRLDSSLRAEQKLTRDLSATKQDLEKVLSLRRVSSAFALWKENDILQAEKLLEQCPKSHRHWGWHYVYKLCNSHDVKVRAAGIVEDLSLLPNGKAVLGVVTLNDDQTIGIWNLDDGQQIKALGRIHQFAIRCGKLTPDGKHIVSGGADGTIRIRDAATGRELRTIHKAATEDVETLAISPDGDSIASGGDDGKLKLWNFATGSKVAETGVGRSVSCVEFLPSGKQILCVADGVVSQWSFAPSKVQKLASVRTLASRGGSVACASPDGKRIAIAGSEGKIQVYESDSGQVLGVIPAHDKSIDCLTFHPSRPQIVSGGRDHLIKVHEISSGRLLGSFKGHTGPIQALVIDPSGQRVISASDDNTVRIWDIGLQQENQTTQLDTEVPIRLAAIDSTSQTALTSGAGISLWNLKSSQQMAGRKPMPLNEPSKRAKAIAVSPNGQVYAELVRDSASLFDGNGKHIRTLRIPGGTFYECAAFSRDGKYLATGDTKQALIWDWMRGEQVSSFTHPEHFNMVVSVAFSPDGRYLATTSFNGFVKVWNIATQEEIYSLKHGVRFSILAFGPDNQTFAAGRVDGRLIIASIREKGNTRIVDDHTERITGLAFSPDGERLVSVSADGQMKVWETGHAREELTFRGIDHPLAIAFSPDGKQIIAIDSQARVLTWDAHSNLW